MANPDRSVYDPPFDDDLMFDAVEEQETARGRPLMILLGIVVALAFAGVVWVAYQQGFQHAETGSAPLLSPDAGPTRVAAAQPSAPATVDSPIYEAMSGNTEAAAPVETPVPPAEEPVALPPAAPSLSGSPSAATADPAPDMTVTEIPAASSQDPAPSQAISSEISPSPAARSRAGTGAVDPLAPGAALPPAPAEVTPSLEEPPMAAMPETPTAPDPAVAAKAERDRLAREAAAKRADAARAAEIKRQQLAAAQPPAAPVTAPDIEAAPAPSATIADPADEAFTPSGSTPAPASTGPRSEAAGRPTLLTPPTTDLPPPGSRPAAPLVASAPPAAAPAPATASEIVPDTAETPAPSSGGGAFVVQIGAFNSAEEAAASWKRVKQSQSSALTGASPEIRQASVNGSTKYRLRATGYADRAGAARACDRLKAGGLQCFVAAR